MLKQQLDNNFMERFRSQAAMNTELNSRETTPWLVAAPPSCPPSLFNKPSAVAKR